METVSLISAEGKAFHVPREQAELSSVIQRMLASEFRESGGEVRFPEIATDILELVVKFMEYKSQVQDDTVQLDEFEIPPDKAIALMYAANFLDI